MTCHCWALAFAVALTAACSPAFAQVETSPEAAFWVSSFLDVGSLPQERPGLQVGFSRRLSAAALVARFGATPPRRLDVGGPRATSLDSLAFSAEVLGCGHAAVYLDLRVEACVIAFAAGLWARVEVDDVAHETSTLFDFGLGVEAALSQPNMFNLGFEARLSIGLRVPALRPSFGAALPSGPRRLSAPLALRVSSGFVVPF